MSFFTKKKREIIPHLREPLLLPYRGGEIVGLFLDNLTNQTELIKERIIGSEKISHRPSMAAFVLYDLTDTEITAEIAEFLIDSIIRMKANVQKLAFVGTTRQGKNRIKKCFTKHNDGLNFAIEYFTGQEPAKEWLIPIT